MELKNLNKAYKNRQVFKNQNFDFSERGIHLIKGKSGVGKTTLFSILTGQDNKYKAAKKLKKFKINEMAIVEQNHYFVEHLSGYENIKLGYENLKLNYNFNDELAKYTKLLGLEKVILNPVRDISTGERAKIALLRVILNDAPLLVCDELTANVDVESIVKIKQLLLEQATKKTIIIISHDENLNEIAHYIHTLEICSNNKKTIKKIEHKQDLKPQNMQNLNKEQIRKIAKLLNVENAVSKQMFWISIMMLVVVGLLCAYNFAMLQKLTISANGSFNENIMAIQFTCDENSTGDPIYGDNLCYDNTDYTYGATLTSKGEEYLNNSPLVKSWTPVYLEQSQQDIYYENYIEIDNDDWATNTEPGVSSGSAENAYVNPKHSFSPSEVENNEYLNPILTADAETSVTGPIDNGVSFSYSDSLSGLQNDGSYYPKPNILPNYYFTESSPISEFVNSLVTYGSMPMPNANEVLISNEFMNLQFNTNDPSKVIGEEISYCTDEVKYAANENNVITSEEVINTTCETFTVSGVYDVTTSSDNEIYFSYDSDATLFFQQNYETAPYIVIELNDSSPQTKQTIVSDLKDIVGVDKLTIEDTINDTYKNQEAYISSVKTIIVSVTFFVLAFLVIIWQLIKLSNKENNHVNYILRMLGFDNKSLYSFNLRLLWKKLLLSIIIGSILLFIIIFVGNAIVLANQAETFQTYSWLMNDVQKIEYQPFFSGGIVFIFAIIITILFSLIVNFINTKIMLSKDLKKLKR